MDEGDTDESTNERKPVRLSLHLMVSRHLPAGAVNWNQEDIIDALNKITHLRLDRENIGAIDNLELLGGGVTNVYLQMNLIKKIDNLECLINLQFLSLSGNLIRKVENLTCLRKLAFLDLSDNLIENFDIDEFPQNLIILNLSGNPCTQLPDYRGSILQDLANLHILDTMEVSNTEKLEAGFAVSSDSEDEEEADMPDVSVKSMASDMSLRSQSRIEAAKQEHRKHAAEISDLRLSTRSKSSSSRLSHKSDLSGKR